MATLDSHRVATDAPLVRLGAASAVIRCAIVHDGRELLVELEIVPGKANRARLGRSPARRARDVLGALRLVLFAPEDLELVRGDPAERRRYLDDLLVARQPRYAGVRADYERVVKQRNALLRTAYLARKTGGVARRGPVHPGGLGRPPGPARRRAARRPAGAGRRARPARGQGVRRGGGRPGRGRHRLPAVGRAGRADRRPGRAGRGADRRAGRVAGPPRSSAAPPWSARTATTWPSPSAPLPAKGYASHGESWSFALALRLAGYDLLRADGIEPVLVLDDVFAELDAGRRERLAELVGGAGQLLVTCAVDEDVPAALRGARYAGRRGDGDAVSD